MRQISRSALVPFTPAQMFALVDDFERYPEFLPWVAEAKLLERNDSVRVGQLSMSLAGVRERFTTRNVAEPPTRMLMSLVEGPFRVLEGEWTFEPVFAADAKSPQEMPRGTRVNLAVSFEFKNRVTDLLLAKVFEASCNSLVDAFAKRAREVYRRD